MKGFWEQTSLPSLSSSSSLLNSVGGKDAAAALAKPDAAKALAFAKAFHDDLVAVL